MTVFNPTPTDVDADSPKAKDLAGQVAVVTGASRGIGQAIAIRLGSLGANVIVNYSRDAAGAARTVAAIQAVGSSAVGVQADVSLGAEVETLFATGRDYVGGIDIVVANAGIDETGGPVLDVSEADCRRHDRSYHRWQLPPRRSAPDPDRVTALNELTDVTPEVVDAAREALLIGH